MTTYLPNQSWGNSAAAVVPAKTLNTTGKSVSESQLTLAGQNAPLRIIYGRRSVGARIANILTSGANWVFQAVIGQGEIDAVESVYLNDAAYSGAVIHYLGTSGQSVNPLLASLFSALGATYADALPGIAYSVFTIPGASITGEPRLSWIVRGHKVFDPRSGLTVWSDNPSLCLAHYLTTYAGYSIDDWDAVADCADANDELVGTEKRRTLGIDIGTVQPTSAWVETLRAYAGVLLAKRGNTVRMVPDRPAATAKSISHAAGHIVRLGTNNFRGTAKLPNRVELRYTDTTTYPWKEAKVSSPTMGLASGMPPSQVAMDGLVSTSAATREVIERINKLWVPDLSISGYVLTDDAGHDLEVGDVIALTEPRMLTDKLIRLTRVDPDYGRYTIDGDEYDPAVYSDALATDPTYPDTALPDPGNPPAPSGLTLTEEVYQQQDGTWSSRIKATWDAPDWSFLVGYRVDVKESGQLIATGTPGNAEYRTPAVQEGKTYTVSVSVVARGGAVSAAAQSSIAAQGKYLAPGPVPAGSFQGFEAGGVVYLRWAQATDIDIWRYRIRRGTTAQSYAEAPVIDLVDALRYTDRTAPVGTWRYWVESVDSVRNESGTPRSLDVEVTLDTNAFLGETLEHTSPTLVNVVEYQMSRVDPVRHFVSSDGAAWNDVFPGAMDTYADPLLSYFDGAASSWTGEAEDFGLELGGSWRGTVVASAISGAIDSELQLATEAAPSTWIGQGALTAKANARFARIEHAAAVGSVMHIQIPEQSINISAVPREESIEFTSSATGAVTVTLANEYTKFISVRIETSGATALIGQPDNEQTGAPSTVDCRIIDASNALVAASGRLIVKGV